MKDEIGILEKAVFVDASVGEAVHKAIKVMSAWEELRRWAESGTALHPSFVPVITRMDTLVPPEPVDELDELCERVRSSTGTAQVSIDLGLLSLIIAEIKAGRK